MSQEFEEINVSEVEVLTPTQKLVGIFFSPGKVFQSILVKPNKFLPLLVIGVLTLGLFLINMGDYKALMLGSLEQTYAAQGIDVSADFIETFAKIFTIASVVLSPAVAIGGVFLIALYYWVFLKIFKGAVPYKQMTSLIAHLGMITLLATLVSSITVVLTGEYATVPLTSLASLFPDSMNHGFLYGALSTIEVFKVWRLVLLVIALKQMTDLKPVKVYVIVGIAFLLGMISTGITLGMNSGLV